MIKVNDRWLRIALPLVPSALFFFDYLTSKSGTVQANIIYIITVILVCEFSRLLIYKSRGWFVGKHKKAKRLLLLIPSGVSMVAALFVISKGLRNYLAFGNTLMKEGEGFIISMNDEQVKLGLIGTSALYGMLVFLFLLGIYELVYHFARLDHTEKERDRLEKEKLQAELQQLKGIVNPHFLFNNLNSLSSLISESPEQAEDFLDELTRVFRYLLRNNETELTTLSQELGFIQSYYHLLQTRYGQAISLEINVDKVCESYLLPPMTLQLLVENAVKHNRISKDEPLCIQLYCDEDKKLVVKNNLLAREQSLESTGIGLKSINSRYRLLEHQPLIITRSDEYFSVVIPLIPSAEVSASITTGLIPKTQVAGNL
ncbi:MAG TPA: histidine kinase [Flavisolibacter sp.]